MAVLHNTTASAALSSGAGATTNRSLTVASGSGRFLIVHLAFWNNTTTVPNGAASVTWNGSEAFTLIYEVTTPGITAAMRLQCWGLKNPTAGSFNVTVTNGSGTIAGGSMAASYYTGVNQTTPYTTSYTDIQSLSSLAFWIGTESSANTKSVAAIARAYSSDTASIAMALVNSIPKLATFATGSGNSSTGTSVTPALPALAPQRGDYVFALCLTKNNATHSCSTTGWSKIGQTNSGASCTVSLWVAQVPVSGTLAAPVITWTGSVANAAKTWYYKDAIGTNAALGAVSTGTAATHTSAGGNTTAARSLAMYADGSNGVTGLGTPSGWTLDDSQSIAATAILANGSKEIASSGTASGAISVTGGAVAWVQQQREIFGGVVQTSRATQLDAGGLRCLLKVDDEDGQTGFNQFGWGPPPAGAGGGPIAGVVNLQAAPPPVNLTQTARFDNAQTFYAPSVKAKVFPSLATNAQAFYAPTVTVAITTVTLTQTARLDNAQVFYGPSIKTKVAASLHTNAQAFYAPAIKAKLAAPAHTNAQSFFAPKIKTTVKQATRFDNAQTFYAPTVKARIVQGARFDNAQSFFAPKIALTVKQSARHDNAQTFFTPITVTRIGAPLQTPRFDNAQVFYGPTVTRATITVAPVRFDNAQTFYAPSVRLTLHMGLATLIPPANAFYAPTIRTTVTLVRFTNAQVFYGPTLRLTLKPSRFDNAQAFYAPTIPAAAARTVTPTRFDNAQIFYGPTVTEYRRLRPSRFDNQQIFFAPRLITHPRGEVATGAIGEPGWYRQPGDARLRKKLLEENISWVIPGSVELKETAPPWEPVVVTPDMWREQVRKRRALQGHLNAQLAAVAKKRNAERVFKAVIDEVILGTIVDILRK